MQARAAIVEGSKARRAVLEDSLKLQELERDLREVRRAAAIRLCDACRRSRS